MKKAKKNKKLCVAHVHWAFPPIIGGVETHLVMLLPALVKKGHDVSLLTGSAEGRKAHQNYKGVKVTRSPMMNLNWLSKRGLIGIEDELRDIVSSFLDREKPQIVHAHNMNYFSKTHAKVLEEEVKKKRNLPLILTAHNSWDDMLFLKLTRDIKWDHIIAVSFYIKKELMGIGCASDRVQPYTTGLISINSGREAKKSTKAGLLL